MHKMLELYFNDYSDFGNKELELQKNEEYVGYEKELKVLTDEIYNALKTTLGKDKAFSIINRLEEAYCLSSLIREEHSFEYGFYTGIQIILKNN